VQKEEDKLCSGCHSIFTPNPALNSRSIRVDRKNPTGCRLCAFIIHRVSSRGPDVLEVQYRFAEKLHGDANLLSLWPAESLSSTDGQIWLSLQRDKRTGQFDQIWWIAMLADSYLDIEFPGMVHYETKLSGSTNSEESLGLAARWIKDCMETHQACNATFARSGFLPT
jgi:hypothetical protein